MSVKFDFEVETKYGTFRDSVVFEGDVVVTEEQIAAIKQERVEQFVASVESLAATSGDQLPEVE